MYNESVETINMYDNNIIEVIFKGQDKFTFNFLNELITKSNAILGENTRDAGEKIC